MHLILTGATGLVGSAALIRILPLLQSGDVSHLSILSRRPNIPVVENNTKVTVIEHRDFLSYTPEVLEKLKGAEGCIWALGVSQTDVDKE
jgi:NAD dependent epimerase/dehydratase family enzyme